MTKLGIRPTIVVTSASNKGMVYRGDRSLLPLPPVNIASSLGRASRFIFVLLLACKGSFADARLLSRVPVPSVSKKIVRDVRGH